jgi:hypothetical protein
MDIAQSTIMPDMVDEEDLEIWAYYKSKKSEIAQAGGYGRIEFRFHNPNGDGMKLTTKGYYVTHNNCDAVLDVVDKEDLDVWDFYKSKKHLIKREGGYGGFEFRFRNLNKATMQLIGKSYYVTNRARKRVNPNNRMTNMRYVAPSVNYQK